MSNEMYEQLFHLNSRPFTSGPFARHYVANKSIHDALTQSHSSIDRGAGPVLVIGENGSGKSLLLAMINEAYASRFNVIDVTCSRDDQRQDLLQSILFALDQPYRDMSEGELRLSLIDFLKPGPDCPNGILLLVDDGHNLSPPLLEEIRLITNFVRDGQPRVRLVLAGTSRLEENLTEPKLESLNQRISARCYLQFMTRDETFEYVNEHLKRAGATPSALFSDDAIVEVHNSSGGCPRFVNQICEQALILAATDNRVPVSAEYIRDAWRDVQGLPTEIHRPEPVQKLDGDEQWTVIEFGSLDDDTSPADTPESSQPAFQELEFVQPELPQIPTQALPQHEPRALPESDSGSFQEQQPEQFAAPAEQGYGESPSNWQGEAFSDADAWEEVEPVESPAVGSDSVTHQDVAPFEQAATVQDDRLQPEAPAPWQQGDIKPQSVNFEEPPAELESPESGAHFESAPTQNFDDPFDESYESEEVLPDQYSPMVAEHNLGSLDVTRAHLDSLKPDQPADPMSADVQQAPTAAQPQYDSPGRVANESSTTFDAAPTQVSRETEPAAQDDVNNSYSFNAGNVQVINVDDTHAHSSTHQQESLEEENRDETFDDDYVQRRTMEILKSLQDSDTTPPADPDVSGYDPMKSQLSQAAVEPEPAVIPPPSDFASTLEVSSVNSEGDRELMKQMAAEKEAVQSETQQILDEIARQRDELRQVVGTDSAADALAYADQVQSADPNGAQDSASELQDEAPQSISFESAMNTRAQDEAEEDTPAGDDKDMIIVSQSYQMKSPQAPEAGHSNEPRSTSTGRAERMDYQALFDQLRNISTDE
ncbi:MAG: AAA family ATPase [Planctomycetota bacterium]